MIHEEDLTRVMETPEERSERYRRYAASMRDSGHWYRRSTPIQRYLAAGVVVIVLSGLLGYFLT